MKPRLSERFKESRGGPIALDDGAVIHMMHELVTAEGETGVRIELRTSSPRPQAARLKIRGGRLRIVDELLQDVVLWSETAPATVVATLVPDNDQGPMSLRIWNAWQDDAGSMQAWIGDAGMVVYEDPDGTIILRCSDGYDAPALR